MSDIPRSADDEIEELKARIAEAQSRIDELSSRATDAPSAPASADESAQDAAFAPAASMQSAAPGSGVPGPSYQQSPAQPFSEGMPQPPQSFAPHARGAEGHARASHAQGRPR